MDISRESESRGSWSLTVTPNPSTDKNQADLPLSYGGPLTLILFGGEALQATAYFCRDEKMLASDASFEHWKTTECKCISKSPQKIAICATDSQEMFPFFKEELANDLKWVLLPYNTMVFGLGKTDTDVENAFNVTDMEVGIGLTVIGFP
ncbi:unnamed protein product [Gongylonema pulchrum]|uniref:FIST_C domain-containing protein n=1 Tax=Gongylonema pulchrum TaxID=637853 RepID=A0A183E5Q7_9BILA|nr:unnamed protein product [Gongylonema pulchrum]